MRIKKKAMLIEFSDHTTNYIFTKMQRYIDIHTCITNTPEKFNKKKFLNTKILHNHECLNGRNFEIKKIINYYDKLSSLDQKILIFLFKRQNIKNLDEKKLVKFINYLFTGWDKYIKKNNINFLIFYLNPHLVYSYIIYIIAKKRGLKIKIFENNKYLNFYYFTNKIEEYPIKLNNNVKNKIIPKHIKKYINQFKNKKNIPTHSIGENNSYGEFLKIIFRVFLKTFFNKENIINYFLKKQKYSFFNYTNFLPYNDKSRHTKFKDNFFYFYVYYISKQLKKNYEGKSVSLLNLNKKNKYIFFSANFQPEKTTCPDGLQFFNQLDVLKILDTFCSKNKNFKILYKEHPAQFYYKKFGFLVKNKVFYRELFKLKNIIFLDLKTNIVDAINYSIVTTTVTGEAGIQSLLLGKPSIIFGYPWYKNFKYIISIKNKDEFNKNLINKAINFNVSKQKIYEEFNKLIETNSIRLIFDNKNWELKNIKKSSKMKKYLNKNFNFFKKNLIK